MEMKAKSLRNHLMLDRMAIIEKTKTVYLEEVDEKEFMFFWWECKLVQSL